MQEVNLRAFAEPVRAPSEAVADSALLDSQWKCSVYLKAHFLPLLMTPKAWFSEPFATLVWGSAWKVALVGNLRVSK